MSVAISISFHLYCCRCVLRFPSTMIKIMFQSLRGNAEAATSEQGSYTDEDQTIRQTTEHSAIPPPIEPKQMINPSFHKPRFHLPSSLRIQIPHDRSFASPCASPTGTIRWVSQRQQYCCSHTKPGLDFIAVWLWPSLV